MFIYAALAYILRVNLPLGLASTWITNPLTAPFIYYYCYQLGIVLLGGPPPVLESEPLSGKVAIFMQIVKPLWVGSLFIGATVCVVGYVLALFIWSLQRRIIGRKTIGEQGAGCDYGGVALDFTSSHPKPGNANPSFSRTPGTGASIDRKSL